MIPRIRGISDAAALDGSYETPPGLPSLMERVHSMEKYVASAIDPISETGAKECKLGKNWDTKMAKHTNTKKNHAAPVNTVSELHFGSSPHMCLYNSSMIPPPVIMITTQVPPERYMVGNIASSFPSFGPDQEMRNSCLCQCFRSDLVPCSPRDYYPLLVLQLFEA